MGDFSNRDLYLRDTWRDDFWECTALPINPNSFGIWEKLNDPKKGMGFWNYALPYTEIMFVAVFVIWQFFHFFLKRLGFIRFTSHMLAGMLLSKSVLKENSAVRNFFFRKDYKESVVGLSGAFAYMMFWFLMGVKMDMGILTNTGKKATIIGLTSVLIPIVVCSGIFIRNLRSIGRTTGEPLTNYIEVVVIYSVQCLSTFPVVGSLLFELKIQNSELGRLAMSSAVVSDFISSILSAILIFLKELKELKVKAGDDNFAFAEPALIHAAWVVAFVIFAIYVFRPTMIWIVKRTPEGRPIKELYIFAIITLVFGSAVYAHHNKQFLPVGPFILGLAVPDGPPLGSAIVEKFEPAIFGTLLPFFVATSATEMNVYELISYKDLERDVFVLAVILLTFVIKFVLTASPALMFHIPLRDSLALALIMSYKGIFELGSYALAYQRGSIRPEAFTITILYIGANSVIIPLILKYIYDPSRIYAGYKKRNMMHLKPNSELRILTCIHRPDDIFPMINLLEASCPTKESPIFAYVLHLIELVGQANPVFISHQMQTRKAGNRSYSDNVIISFNQFQRDSWGKVSINTFTAVSALKSMHDDICMLALNNNTSLIVLPFHQTWSGDGSTIISDNAMIRGLNQSNLELAPCSVGILVYRSSFGRRTVQDVASRNSSYQVCMIFLGGKDDREALTLAKRMAQDSRLSLTVVHLIATGDEPDTFTDWDSMLDSAELRDVKQNTVGEEYVIYVDEVLKDGSETPLVLKSLVGEYDMFVVGRGKGRKSILTEGLEEWSEFKELGVIGDLLTSSDLHCRASVLVVQQQQQMI